MKQAMVLLCAVCLVVSDMVPRDKVQQAMDAEKPKVPGRHCALTTPCAWSIYDSRVKSVEMIITNSYCECPENLFCMQVDDKPEMNAYVHYCRESDS